MIALRTDSLALVAHALEAGAGALAIAARNASDEWVLTGEEPALRAAARLAPATRLTVRGPWHAPSMASALPAFRRALAALEIQPGRAAWVCNATGRLADPRRAPNLLARQLVRPVKWLRCMQTLVALGVTDLVICGPGKVLRHLARGHVLRVHRCEHADDLDRVSAALSAKR